MKLFKHLLLLWIFLYGFSASAEAVSRCEVQFGVSYVERMSFAQRVFRKIPGVKNISVITSKKWTEDLVYNEELYKKIKQEMITGDLDFSDYVSGPLPVEILLAGLDVVSSMENNGLSSIEELLKSGDPHIRKTITSQLRDIMQTPGLSRSKGQRFIETLYLFSKPEVRKNWYIFRRWESFKFKAGQRIEREVAQGNFSNIFERLGILVEDSNVEKFRDLIANNKTKINWMVTIGLTYGVYHLTQHYLGLGMFVPMGYPKLDLFNAFKLKAEDISLVDAVGLDEVLENHIDYRINPRFIPWAIVHGIDQTYNIVRDFVIKAMLTYLAYIIINNWDTTHFLLSSLVYSQGEIAEIYNQSLEIVAAREAEIEGMIASCDLKFEDGCSAEMVQQIKDHVNGKTLDRFKLPVQAVKDLLEQN